MPFKAQIYKVGINPCVEVPASVTAKMKAIKGYIPVAGKINGHAFKQTLVPVKGGPYRLYVNIPMLKGGETKVGDIATFTLKQDRSNRKKDYPMNVALKKALTSNKLLPRFNALTKSRKKDILKYLGSLKNEETIMKNVDKVIRQLKESRSTVRVP
jgi:hypothetical protein